MKTAKNRWVARATEIRERLDAATDPAARAALAAEYEEAHLDAMISGGDYSVAISSAHQMRVNGINDAVRLARSDRPAAVATIRRAKADHARRVARINSTFGR